MPSLLPSSSRRHRGSALLASCVQRMACMLAAVALLWLLTGWAMGW
ncbi:hypothetical protein H0A70_14480 [Alcaligenaceae bacterium]|nr:hypothetical protein [Alcaligenaceae bacterium]